ncbi:hypothetical protein WN55_04571 [Dufourea novaeangliae]|uniref:Uncharacterized protein n=1 Tax=Dufourea novaeangliae TaxID=178035 RepID=A0A154P197_DUFNO|nr:hypothetical protein WN55_04571 [Dufourea novaeangliae]
MTKYYVNKDDDFFHHGSYFNPAGNCRMCGGSLRARTRSDDQWPVQAPQLKSYIVVPPGRCALNHTKEFHESEGRGCAFPGRIVRKRYAHASSWLIFQSA